jgi:hypothetical protein
MIKELCAPLRTLSILLARSSEQKGVSSVYMTHCTRPAGWLQLEYSQQRRPVQDDAEDDLIAARGPPLHDHMHGSLNDGLVERSHRRW